MSDNPYQPPGGGPGPQYQPQGYFTPGYQSSANSPGGYPPPRPEREGGMSTGAKIGLGVLIGCTGVVLIAMLVLLGMGACTCSACSSCCSSMEQSVQKAGELEAKEAAKLNSVGVTVSMGSVSITVADAQRQEQTVVVTMDVENSGYSSVTLDPVDFVVEDSDARSWPVDKDKAAMTIDGLSTQTQIEAGASATVRTVHSVPQESSGLTLIVVSPEGGSNSRRFSLGI